jgi:hypothetical protein
MGFIANTLYEWKGIDRIGKIYLGLTFTLYLTFWISSSVVLYYESKPILVAIIYLVGMLFFLYFWLLDKIAKIISTRMPYASILANEEEYKRIKSNASLSLICSYVVLSLTNRGFFEIQPFIGIFLSFIWFGFLALAQLKGWEKSGKEVLKENREVTPDQPPENLVFPKNFNTYFIFMMIMLGIAALTFYNM